MAERKTVPLNIRIITEDGDLISELVLDPTRDYQPQQPKCELCRETGANDVSRHHTARPAVCWFRTSRTDVSSHPGLMSQVIPD